METESEARHSCLKLELTQDTSEIDSSPKQTIFLSWTFEKEGITLEWRWRCKPSPDNRKTTATILDFLMDANIRLSEEVVRKTESFDRLKEEAQKCLIQSEKLSAEKNDILNETQLYCFTGWEPGMGTIPPVGKKFVSVLNSKKAKLRELRDRLSKQEAKGKLPQEEDASTDGTEPYRTESDDDVRSEE
uniref:Uncharacterized protein n=1 Tax=Chenopodium quinoa TaxID=63459 RepID=A0A803LMF1_CHEQI